MLKKTKKKLYILLIAILGISMLLLMYLNLFYSPTCQNYECWQERMIKCKKTSFVNEQTEASWGYEIKGKTDNQCDIEVTLLLAKKGDLEIDKLIGHSMICSYKIGTATYAEKDLGSCHGLLKEELQTLIINKLHAYILENLGQVAEGIEQGI